ncbi:MAG TPA: sulfite exporter TauE/SafE family protein, partial [bacterium]|nr:sulfite exporter TauE/SafE family protein [bacterium]
GNVVQAVSYFKLGLYGGTVLGTALLACVPMAIGTWLGLVLQERLHPVVFSRVVLVLVCLTSINLIVEGVLGRG